MGIKTLIAILATVGFSVNALAEHHEGEKQPFSITGDFAGSIQFSDNENNGSPVHDDFIGDLVQFSMEKNWGKSNFFMTIGYGRTANAVNGPSVADVAGTTLVNNINVLQAFYKYTTSYGLGATFGKFESPVGHETYNHMDNSQYTRTYGFALAPFFNTGARVEYGQDMWKAGLIVSNGSGMETDFRDKNKTMALVVDVDPIENLHIDLNYVTGTEGDSTGGVVANAPISSHQIAIIDASVGYMINEMFDVAVNYIGQTQEASAAGSTEFEATSLSVYGNANFGMFGLGLRFEQFDYDNGFLAYNGLGGDYGSAGFATGGLGANALGAVADNSITAFTLAARAEIDQNAMFLLEFRQESSDENIWNDDDGNITDSQSILTAAFMYRF